MNFKFTPENTKRIFLAGLVLVAVIYGFSSFLIGPALSTAASSRSAMSKIESEIEAATTTKKRLANMRANVEQAAQLEKTLFVDQPKGDPIAWFPPRVENFFKKAGISRCLATLSPPSETEIPGFRTYDCTIEFPAVSFMQFGVALASFENHDNLIEVRSLSIQAQPDNPEFQSVSLGIRVILKP